MKNSKVSCLTWTVVFLALAGASGWFVYRRAPWFSAAAIGAFAGGVALVVTFSWIVAVLTRIAEWGLIAQARLGREPRDGKRTAILGTLRGKGELTSPFARERCILYSYEILAREITGRERQERKAFEGFAMVPLSIEHDTERTRILAQPELPKLPPTQPKSGAGGWSVRRFVESTTFAPATAAEQKDLSHTDGHLRLDYRHDPTVANLDACRTVEHLVRADTTVCALGIYRADRHALVAPVTLRTGGAFGIAAAWRVVNAVLATAFAAAIAITAVVVFCANFPLDAVEQSHPQWTINWWEIDLERLVDKHVRTPMVRSGMLHSPGYRLQQLCDGCAKGRLEVDGRPAVELQHARYVGGKAIHLSAKPGDRDGLTLAGERVMLTLDGKTADVPPSWLQPNDIETSLDSNGQYAGRVTVIAPDGWIRCRVSFNTRVDADAWLPSRQ